MLATIFNTKFTIFLTGCLWIIVQGLLWANTHKQQTSSCIKTIVFMRHAEMLDKPAKGQLNCQGLNRALKLPAVLNAKFGKPFAIFAADPNITIANEGCATPHGCCDYLRPLATIEPTAIYFSMAVNTQYGMINPYALAYLPAKSCTSPPPTPFLHVPLPLSFSPGICKAASTNGNMELAKEIVKNPIYCNQKIFVSWEHKNIPYVVYYIYHLLGINAINHIPLWPYGICDTPGCTPGTCSPHLNYDTLYIVKINQNSSPPSIDISLDHEGLNGQSMICPT